MLQNFNYGTHATITIAGIPNMVYYSQDYATPGVRCPNIVYPTLYSPLNVPSSHLEFDPFTINFLMSENLAEYVELFNWMKRLGAPECAEQYSVKPFQFSDAEMIIYSNQQNPIVKFKIYDMFPSDLAPISYTATEDFSLPKTTSVTFAIRDFDIFPVTQL